MASNEDEYKAMQQPMEVKKENNEIDDNEPCSSTCTNIPDDMHENIKTLNYDGIASSIEIVQQLQKAITDTNQRESKECTKVEIEIKQDKEPEGVLSHSSVSWDNLKSEQQQCSSSEPMVESNLDKLIQELSSDELNQSIEIVKQLQKFLVYADGSECVGEFSEIHPAVKQEEESDIVLSEPGNPLSEESRYDEIHVSVAIIKQLQKSFGNSYETEKEGESSQSVQEIKEEKKCKSTLTHSPTRLEEKKYASQQYSSRGSMAEINLDKLIQELSSDELDQSIEIVKQLQKVLVNGHGSENAGEFSGIHSDVKQEKKSDILLSDPERSLSQPFTSGSSNSESNADTILQELMYDDINLSIAIIEQLEKAFGNSDETEKQGEYPQSDQEITEEEKCQSALTDSLKCLEEQKYPSQDCSGKYNDNKLGCKEEKHLDQLSSNIISKGISHYLDLLSSDIEKRPKTISFIYSNIDGNFSSSINQLNANKLNLPPVEASLNNSSASKDISKLSGVEERVGSRACTGESPNCDSLTRQRRICTSNKTFTCKICGANFTESCNLTVHMSIHTEEILFDCKRCGAKFTQSSALKQHMIIHTGEKPFDCKSCGSKFALSSTLKEHMRIHTGERPFECKSCGVKFMKSSYLKRHMGIHTGEKPFDCKSYGSKFSRYSHLKRHMRIHTGERPFACKCCGAKFTHSSNLKRHMKIHTGERPFECKSCGYKFIQSIHLKGHMKIHNG